MDDERTIVLVGPMAGGKTATGSSLARRMGIPLFDSDDLLHRATGSWGADLVARRGLAALHAVEGSILLHAVNRPERSVIAAAASVVDNRDLVDRLRHGGEFVALLTATAEECAQRSDPDDHRRPLTGQERDDLLERRMDSYRRVADVEIDTTWIEVEQATDIIINTLWITR